MPTHDRERFDLEGELGAARPRAPRRFIDTLAARAGATRGGRRGARPAVVALVGIGSLAVAGGIGFAASTAIESSKVTVKRVATEGAREIAVRAAAADQYSELDKVLLRDNKPPEVTVTPPTGGTLKAVQPANRTDVILRTTLEVKESGNLSITVFSATRKNKNNQPLQIKINGVASSVDGDALGKKLAPSFIYAIMKPRLLTVEVSVPGSELVAGERLNLRLAYTQFDTTAPTTQRKTVVDVPAVAPAQLAKPVKVKGKQTFTVTLTEAQIDRIRALLAEPGDRPVQIELFGVTAYTTVAWQGATKFVVSVHRSPGTGKKKKVTLATLDPTAVLTAENFVPTGSFRIKAHPDAQEARIGR